MTDARTITFNTGRQYTAEGQLIIATLASDGTVTFFDHSRQIDGEIEGITAEAFSPGAVLAAYDAGQYSSTARSLSDGMSIGGCNTRDAAERAQQARTTTAPKAEQLPALSAEQIEALEGFAAEHGRRWKATLNAQWMNASAPQILHQLRNSHGPRWLTRYRLQTAARRNGSAAQ